MDPWRVQQDDQGDKDRRDSGWNVEGTEATKTSVIETPP
jgi:hypothetical protein